MTLSFEGISDEAIKASAVTLTAGGIALLPADTVYGFFGRADLPEPVQRVYGIKKRDRGKPFVLYTNEASVGRWADVTPLAAELIDHFWPQALALVLRKKPAIPDWFTNGLPTVAVMTASNPLMSAVVAAVPGPLFGTTVNYSGEASIKTAAAAARFRELVDVMVADDRIPVYNKSSTMVDCTVTPPAIIREEAIPAEAVRAFLPQAVVDASRRR